MGRLGIATEIPDTSGLPEYFISEVFTEIDGPNVRLVCGVKRGGITHWLYSCVIRADRLLVTSASAAIAAEEAFNFERLLAHRTGH
jgi:hypothetical protein